MRLLLAFGFIMVSAKAFAQAPHDVGDLVGARGSTGEMELKVRGYRGIRSNLWWNEKTGICIRVKTAQGRYTAIDILDASDCGKRKASSSTQASENYAYAPQAGFDCAKASSQTEEIICAAPALSELDGEMTRLYQLVFQELGGEPRKRNQLKATQRGFLKERDDCWKAEDRNQCVRDVTAYQIAELRALSSEAQKGGMADPSAGPFSFQCPGVNYKLKVTFAGQIQKLAIVAWHENKLVLWQAPSSDGKYEYRGSLDRKAAIASISDGKVYLTLPGVAESMRCVFSGTR